MTWRKLLVVFVGLLALGCAGLGGPDTAASWDIAERSGPEPVDRPVVRPSPTPVIASSAPLAVEAQGVGVDRPVPEPVPVPVPVPVPAAGPDPQPVAVQPTEPPDAETPPPSTRRERLAAMGQIQLQAIAGVQLHVDGRPVPMELELAAYITNVTEGSHRVELVNLLGRPVAWTTVEVPAGQRLRLRYAKKEIEDMGLAPLWTPSLGL